MFPGRPLLDPVTLCGTQFGLHIGDRWLKRHRIFESNVDIHSADTPDSCRGRLIGGVYGKGGQYSHPVNREGFQLTREPARTIMGVPWMTRGELAQAIPPAYTEHIGKQLLTVL